MDNQTTPTSHICGCCKRELPIKAFYINKRTQKPDNYCKVCRKENSSKYREANRYITQNENKARSYPIITQVKDPLLRRELIRHALQMVAESAERKQNIKKEQELWEE